MKITKTRLRELIAEEVLEAFGLDILGRPKAEPVANPAEVLANIQTMWPSKEAEDTEKIKALKDIYRLLDDALIGNARKPGLLNIKEEEITEATPEDEKLVFDEIIRNTAHQLSQTHSALTPVQQEAYENLLAQAADSLSDRREDKRHR